MLSEAHARHGVDAAAPEQRVRALHLAPRPARAHSHLGATAVVTGPVLHVGLEVQVVGTLVAPGPRGPDRERFVTELVRPVDIPCVAP